MVIADRALTLEEFLRLPEREPPLEYEDGEVTRKVSPKLKHSTIQTYLAAALLSHAGSPPAIGVFNELRVTFGGRSVVPDVSVFRRERVPLDEHGEPVDDVFLPPDLAIEVLSPKQLVTRVVRRCLWYVANGVRIALIIDAYDRSVLLFRPGAQPQALRGQDPIDLSDVVPGFVITVAELFGFLRFR